MFLLYCCTLKDSNKIQNFVNKILIVTAADTVAAGGVNGMILLLVQFSHHLYPKIFFAIIITSPVSQDTIFYMIVISPVPEDSCCFWHNYTAPIPKHYFWFLKYNQQDATFSRSVYFYKSFYMFQAVPPPIIRSTKLYIQHQVLSNQYCCLLLLWMRWNVVPSYPQ